MTDKLQEELSNAQAISDLVTISGKIGADFESKWKKLNTELTRLQMLGCLVNSDKTVKFENLPTEHVNLDPQVKGRRQTRYSI